MVPTGPEIQLVVTESRFSELETVGKLNALIFHEERIINSLEHDKMLTVIASSGGEPVGFKIGYSLSETRFYSAKGGVLPAFRRRGIARSMLHLMMATARRDGFRSFEYDTFPNLYKPMLILGLQEEFQVRDAGWNEKHGDWRIRLYKDLVDRK